MASVEAGPTVLTGSGPLTPAGAGVSPSSAQAYSEVIDWSVNPDVGAFGETLLAASNSTSVGQIHTSTAQYKMRAVDQGAVAPGYVYWVTSPTADFAGTFYSTASPTPIGAMLAGSVVVADSWFRTI